MEDPKVAIETVLMKFLLFIIAYNFYKCNQYCLNQIQSLAYSEYNKLHFLLYFTSYVLGGHPIGSGLARLYDLEFNENKCDFVQYVIHTSLY